MDLDAPGQIPLLVGPLNPFEEKDEVRSTVRFLGQANCTLAVFKNTSLSPDNLQDLQAQVLEKLLEKGKGQADWAPTQREARPALEAPARREASAPSRGLDPPRGMHGGHASRGDCKCAMCLRSAAMHDPDKPLVWCKSCSWYQELITNAFGTASSSGKSTYVRMDEWNQHAESPEHTFALERTRDEKWCKEHIGLAKARERKEKEKEKEEKERKRKEKEQEQEEEGDAISTTATAGAGRSQTETGDAGSSQKKGQQVKHQLPDFLTEADWNAARGLCKTSQAVADKIKVLSNRASEVTIQTYPKKKKKNPKSGNVRFGPTERIYTSV